MNYKVLYRKYRPQTFDDVYGQEYVVKTLKNSIKNNHISHAYIFTGPRGTGKTSLAKIFARSINCLNPKDGNPCLECESCKLFSENPDIIEIDAASNNGVDEIRELINNIKLAPSNSKYKVYIIDEVHMLSQSAFNALLLTLEEPPAHVVFILATTDIQNVPITIISRTQRFDFSRITVDNILKRLTFVRDKENINIEDEALKEIALLSDGGLRDALSILDQVASSTTNKITADTIINSYGSISLAKIKDFVEYIDKNDIKQIIEMLDIFRSSGIDSKVFIAKLVTVLKEKAVNIKLDTEKESRLSFDNIREIIFELNDMLNNRMISIDPYTIIQMIVLSYMGNEKNTEKYFPGNEKTAEKEAIPTKKTSVEVKKEKIIKVDKNLANLDQFKKIRINNSFVDAKKQDLKNTSELWNKFINKSKELNSKIYSIILDTQIAVSSSSYAIILSLSDSSANLINKNIVEIEELFNKTNNSDFKLISLSTQEWAEEKQTYITNLNKHKKYDYLQEIDLDISDNTEVDSIVSNIFSESKIEIEKE